ncbi:MAG: LPS assembly protein LptD [Simkaniaceae bacterium]|nr:LPS assembly protein LptD [Simkaniaceae bacterium]
MSRFPPLSLALLFTFFFLCRLSATDHHLRPYGPTSETIVKLNRPVYENGTFSTEEGGIIEVPDDEFYLQARKITYVREHIKHPVSKVTAEGDLLLLYRGRTYVGERLEYDFLAKTGLLYQGKVAFEPWVVGGDRVHLLPDRTVRIRRVFTTTNDRQKPVWSIEAKRGEVSPNNLFEAKGLTLRLLGIPLFYFPTWQVDLNRSSSDIPITYYVREEKGLLPRFGVRYRAYQREENALFFLLYVRPFEGVGGSVESEYLSPSRCTSLQTQSYLDRDLFYRDTTIDRPLWHYRLRGFVDRKSEDETWQCRISYDKVNDRNLITDFATDHFETSAVRRTSLSLQRATDSTRFGISASPRINSFQGFKQELPVFFWTHTPYSLGRTGLIAETRITGEYLSYVSADRLLPVVPDFRASRFGIDGACYRPFSGYGFNVTPFVGFRARLYGTAKGHTIRQALLDYRFLAHYKVQRRYESVLHTVRPYLRYRGLTTPLAPPDIAPVFDITDGLRHLSELKIGIENAFYSNRRSFFNPDFVADLSLYAFFANDTFTKKIPKALHTLSHHRPFCLSEMALGWNMEKGTLDFINTSLAWTLSEKTALYTEIRRRGRFDWRRSDRDNYIFEVTRPISDLLLSPLSDRRNTFLTGLQCDLYPGWHARIEGRVGTGRAREPFYYATKVELLGLIETGWQLRIGFTHSPAPGGRNARYAFGFSLAKRG